MSEKVIAAELWGVFLLFTGSGGASLDSRSWTKLLRDAGVLDGSYPSGASDVVFAQVCPRGSRRLTFDDFVIALGRVSEQKYGPAPDGFARVVDAVLRCAGPSLSGTRPPELLGIFAKITDSSLYTGSHRHRFDGEGRGLGLAGRDSIAVGSGTTPLYHAGEPVRELAQLLRPAVQRGGTHLSSETARRRAAASPRGEARSPGGGLGSPSSAGTPLHREPPGSAHYGNSPSAGSPQARARTAPSPVFRAGGPIYMSPGAAARAGAAAAAAAAAAEAAAAAAASPAGGARPPPPLAATRFLRMPSTAALDAVFEAYALFGSGSGGGGGAPELSSAAWAKMCRETGLVLGGPVALPAGAGGGRQVPPAAVDVAFAKARGPGRRALAYGPFLTALRLLAVEVFPARARGEARGGEAPGSPAGEAPGSPAGEAAGEAAEAAAVRLAGLIAAAGGPALNVSTDVARVVSAAALGSPDRGLPSVFAKMTDSALYTGAHAHRFDAEGRGRGRAGRDHVPGVDDELAR